MQYRKKIIMKILKSYNENKLDDRRFSIKAGWSDLSKDKYKSTKRAMNKYRKEHPNCELTGSNKKVQIHHIVPVWSNPDISDDPDNFIALSTCANIHHIFGHDRSFAKKYVDNIRELSEKFLSLQEDMVIVHRPSIKNTKTSRLKTVWRKYSILLFDS